MVPFFTLALAIGSFILAMVLGIFFGAMSTSKRPIFKWRILARIFVESYQNTPLGSVCHRFYGLPLFISDHIIMIPIYGQLFCVRDSITEPYR